jgi:hypothetical protein
VQRIAQNPTIATNVHTRMLLPPILESAHGVKCDECRDRSGANFVCYNVGNATASMTLYSGSDEWQEKKKRQYKQRK